MESVLDSELVVMDTRDDTGLFLSECRDNLLRLHYGPSEDSVDSKFQNDSCDNDYSMRQPEDDDSSDKAGEVKKDDDYFDSCSEISCTDGHDDLAKFSQISSPSLRSAKLTNHTEAESMVHAKDENVEHQKNTKEEYFNLLDNIFRGARFFSMKSNNMDNVELSKTKGVWATLAKNEAKLNQAFKETRNVILLYSVNFSREFCGFARLTSGSKRGGQEVSWSLPPTLNQSALGGLFNVDWVSKNELSFDKTRHLFNPWNNGLSVKIGRDGQEIEPHVASALCHLFPMDSSTDWDAILQQSKNASQIVRRPYKIFAPLGSNANAPASVVGRGRKEGVVNIPRDPKRRLSHLHHYSRVPAENESGRATQRRRHSFENDSKQREMPTRLTQYDDWYKFGSRMSGQSYSEVSSRESYRRRMGYSYQHMPPPVTPLPFAPPPPFNSIPPPPPWLQQVSHFLDYHDHAQGSRDIRDPNPRQIPTNHVFGRNTDHDRQHRGRDHGRCSYGYNFNRR